MNNMPLKAAAAVTAFVTAIYGFTAIAAAAATTPTPYEEGKAVFDGGWPKVLELIKNFAPIVIVASLTLLAIRKVVGSVKRGKAPSF
jgi:hypothetical protein